MYWYAMPIGRNCQARERSAHIEGKTIACFGFGNYLDFQTPFCQHTLIAGETLAIKDPFILGMSQWSERE